VKTEKKVYNFISDISSMRKALTSSFRRFQSSPPNEKETVQSGDAFEHIAFKAVFEVVKF
jgi:hypothetical protein